MKKVLILTVLMAFAMMLSIGVQSASADQNGHIDFAYFTSGGGDSDISLVNTDTTSMTTLMVRETPGQQADGSAVLATGSAPLTPAYTFTLTDDTKLVSKFVNGLAGQAYVMTTLGPRGLGLVFSQTREQDGDLRMTSTEMITGDSAYGGRYTGSAQISSTIAMKMRATGAAYALTSRPYFEGQMKV